MHNMTTHGRFICLFISFISGSSTISSSRKAQKIKLAWSKIAAEASQLQLYFYGTPIERI